MTYTEKEAREELLDVLGRAIDHVGLALAALGAAYEQLDEHAADRLEAELFAPVQAAYGRAQRIHAAFAQRHGLPGGAFAAPSPGAPSTTAGTLVDRAVAASGAAAGTLATLQDSMLPAEVGDVELRAGITEVRELLDPVGRRARDLQRTLGR